MKNWSVPTFEMYTDGGCHGNPGPGGWAWAMFSDGKQFNNIEGSGNKSHTTNNEMELTAMLECLKYLLTNGTSGVGAIYTDSTYVKRGMLEWMEGWRSRGWKKAGNKPLANEDLWRDIYKYYNALDNKIDIFWVKAHDTSPGNLYVDRLNQIAITELELDKF